MTLDWRDGLPYSGQFEDVYFSVDSGLEETRHVFLHGNQLLERFAALPAGASLCIGETGFGTGLNFLCAWQAFEQAAPAGCSLDFFSVEKYPLTLEELRAALALWPALKPEADALLACWERRVPGWNRWTFALGRIRLTLAYTDVLDAVSELHTGSVDAWFLDGFSPARNPDMWAQPVLDHLARASRSGATLATYTSAGWVRRGLLQAGFQVERASGFGRKRDMLRGIVAHTEAATNVTIPTRAIVIGGGLAGCAAAHALAQRGIQVVLLERQDALAPAASGNPLGVLHARFGASAHPLHQFVLAAYGHALAWLDAVLPVDGAVRSECGLLQLDCSPEEHKRISRLLEREWPQHVLQAVDAQQATALAGLEMPHAGLWFPAGGWVVPTALCAKLVQHPRIELRYAHHVTQLEQTAAGWRAAGEGWTLEADIAVVSCAHAARQLQPCAHLPLTAVRGQLTLAPQTAASLALRSVVCGSGYCAPAHNGLHVIGATHVFEDESLELRVADHADNLERLAAQMPAVRAALGDMNLQTLAGRAATRCSAPGAAPFIGELQAGLYSSLAHGTRGLLTAGLAAEIIAAHATGQLAPLPASLIKHVAARR